MSNIQNTDRDWREIGASEPYFGVLADPAYRRDTMDESALRQFWQSGRTDVAAFLGELRRYFGPFQPKLALDFGCGVGRMTRAMSNHAGHVVGVDVSEGMLEQARDGAPYNVTFQTEMPDAQFDWIASHIVFQHIPPRRGYELYQQLLDRLAVGGAITLHFTIYRDREMLTLAMSEVATGRWDGETMVAEDFGVHPVGTMLMYDYDLTRIVALAHRAGIHQIHLGHLNHGGNHGVILYGIREK